MTPRDSTEGLWQSAVKSSAAQNGRTGQTPPVSTAVQRYFSFAIAPGTSFASTVRLKMHGEIKLGRWHPFVADQVISWDHGMIWSARVRMYGLPISGSDRLLDGKGAMQWKLFGVVPVMHAEGTDITRSSAGRMNIESLWLPSILAGMNVAWSAGDANDITARFSANAEDAVVEFRTTDTGELKSVSMLRWGNAGGGAYRLIPFGALIEQSGTFNGFTIPMRLRVGWFFGSDRFESEGEFFRVTVEDAEYC